MPYRVTINNVGRPGIGEVRFLDEKTFWLAPHCGPGTFDGTEPCAFCDNTCEVCAKLNSDSIKEKHAQVCGGSGFWCHACGRFWAQDSCGESEAADMRNANPALHCLVVTREGKDIVFCWCGQPLYQVPCEENKSNWLTFASEGGAQHYCPKHSTWAVANAEGVPYRKGAPVDATCEACWGDMISQPNNEPEK